MPLTNSQYDEIMSKYNKRHMRAVLEAQERKNILYDQLPELDSLDRQIASISVSRAKALIDGRSHGLDNLEDDIKLLSEKKKSIIIGAGYPEDYLDPAYQCPDCKDTGYINNRKCHCLKKAEADYLYADSNIDQILQTENFATFSYDYYSDSATDPVTGKTSLELAKNAVSNCLNFISDFGKGDNSGTGLIFYGNTGTGKTFLSNCVTKELLDKGFSCLYFSAYTLFKLLVDYSFNRAGSQADYNHILNCDLLIIDDLGTEAPNAYSIAQFFQCLNYRIVHNKPLIISTNLELGDIRDIYSERIASRITEKLTPVRLWGNDIRISKKLL